MRQFIVYALTIFGLLSLEAADACTPSTYCVDQTVDQLPADPNVVDCPVDGSCTGRCSLREAILRLNAGCGGTIQIQAGTYAMSGSAADRGEDSAAIGDFDIDDDIEIQGAGASRTIIDGGGIDRVFDVQRGMRLHVKDITIRNGEADGHGGGIQALGDLVIENSAITGNSTNFNGGGIALSASVTVILRNSLVSSNDSLGGGGGLGVFGTGGTMILENSTISGNRADGPGGGVTSNVSLRFYNVTVTGNSADDDRSGGPNEDGGGIYFGGGSFETHNSIIAGNSDAGGANYPDCATAGGSYHASSDYNIVGKLDGCPGFFGRTGDQSGSIASPLNTGLSALGNHGGETPTHSLLSGSPAINQGDPVGCKDNGGSDFTADQRGFARPVGGRCDVGAYENGICGDGATDAGESCDDANASNADACLVTCEAASCGDGFVETGVEACDDGNADDSDACLSTCVSSTCGDGIVQSGVEECDDRAGNSDSSADTCRTDCTNPRCGDGVVDSGEECDDANTADGDGCSATCESESAGTTGGSGGCSLIR